MKTRAAIFAGAIFLAGSLRAAGLTGALSSEDAGGDIFKVRLVVNNSTTATANLVSATLQYPVLITLQTPVAPASANLSGLSSVTFTWIFAANGNCLNHVFTASASAQDLSVSTGDIVTLLTSAICSQTPTPTPTPWIQYVTPEPTPSQGDAWVGPSLYRPDLGGLLNLGLSVPGDGKVSILIHDRNGRSIKTIEFMASAGRYVKTWDGTDEQGARVAAGIYGAFFRGPGLSKSMKIALLR